MALTVDKSLELLQGAHGRGRLAHAFTISGATGSGKRRLAAQLIQTVNPPAGGGGANLFGEEEAVEPSTLEDLEGEFVRVVRPQSKSRRITVEQIRELEQAFQMAAPAGVWKVGVVVDAERMFDEPSNAFLKTLEEPPPHCLMLLITSQPELLLPTIRSRCVNLVLQDGPRVIPLDEEERAAFAQLLARGGRERSARGAMMLKGGFESLLARRREMINAESREAFKEECAVYKQATEGDWLEKREAYHKALAEAEYLGMRSALVDWLVGWLGDAVRQKAGAPGLVYPESAAETATFAEGEDLPGLLQRFEAMQEMRELLFTNVQEALAIEVCFLRAFG